MEEEIGDEMMTEIIELNEPEMRKNLMKSLKKKK